LPLALANGTGNQLLLASATQLPLALANGNRESPMKKGFSPKQGGVLASSVRQLKLTATE